MSVTLSGRVALVTGGSGGIGAETAMRLAAQGARVVVHYNRNAEAAQAVVDRIRAAGGEAISVGGDLCDPAAVEAVAQAPIEAFGRLDILINNAGISTTVPFGEVTPENFDREFRTNLLSAILVTQAAVARFGAEGGRIVNVASNLVYAPFAGLELYTATKAALDNLTLGWAKALGPRGIAVNAVAPGATHTGQTAWIPQEGWDGIAGATPLGRTAQPDDVADAILFLASPSARWVTGRTLIVDGGLA